MPALDSSHKPQLDGLRAFAVGAVLIHHFLPTLRYIPADFLTLGPMGVRLFFVLSGYLITGILLRSRGQSLGTSLKRFYTRRTLRIFPIYYITLGVLFLCNAPLIREYIHWHAAYLSNFLLWRNPAALGDAGHFWSLAVEEQFYLLWPFVVLRLPYKRLFGAILLAVGIGVGWKIWIGVGPDTVGGYCPAAILMPGCLDSLGMGALLAYVENDERWSGYRQQFLNFACITGICIIAIQAAVFVSNRTLYLTLWGATSFFGVSFVFTWLVGRAAVGFQGPLKLILEWRPVMYLGRISYGMYLFHNFMPALSRQLAAFFNCETPGILLNFLISSALTITLAALSWHWIEKPINQFKNLVAPTSERAPRSSAASPLATTP